MPKLMENSPFHIFNDNHIHITDDQPTFTVHGKSRKIKDLQCNYRKRQP